jgi:hypothetical protein
VNGETTAARAARYRFYAEEAERSARNGPTITHRYYYSAVAAEWRALADEVEARRTPRTNEA